MRNRLLLLMVLSLLLVACSKEEKQSLKHEEWNGTIRVAFANESDFYSDFGQVFKFYYPNVRVEIVPRPRSLQPENLQTYFEDVAPDVLVLDRIEYEALSREGYLTDLFEYVAQDQLDLDSYIERVTETLRLDGRGTLYGLSPYFRARALFYNKDLFDAYGIPYPQDPLTWDQVMETARMFAAKGAAEYGHYGLYHMIGNLPDKFNPFILVNLMSSSENISIMDDEDQIRLVDTRVDELYRMVIEGLRLQAIAPPPEDETSVDLFREGHAAMRYDGYYGLDSYSNLGFELGIAGEPTTDGYTPHFDMDTIFAISNTSYHKELAWRLIAFVMGDDYMRLKSRSFSYYGLPVSKKYFDAYIDSSLDKSGFYANTALRQDELNEFLTEPINGFLEVVRIWSSRAAAGEISIDDSLREIESELRERLHK